MINYFGTHLDQSTDQPSEEEILILLLPDPVVHVVFLDLRGTLPQTLHYLCTIWGQKNPTPMLYSEIFRLKTFHLSPFTFYGISCTLRSLRVL